MRRPHFILALAAVLSLVALWRAQHLRLRPELDQMLPENQPSVLAMKELRRRLPALSNVFIVLEHEDPERLQRLADRLVPALESIGPPWVGRAESGLQEARDFLMPRAGLFASVSTLETLRDDIEARRQRAFARQFGADLSDDPPPPPLTADWLRSHLGPQAAALSDRPGGYHQSADGKALVVVVRSEVAADDLGGAAQAVERIKEVVTDTAAASPGVRVSYAGDLVTGLTEYGAIRADLMSVGILGVSLVLAVVLLFYRRVRPLLLMGVTIFIGCALTFGITELAIGTLNTASGFMFSIVAGNGINFGIILQSRFLEERGRGRSVAAALIGSVAQTWRPTLAAALAAAGAYAAMGMTDLRAFRDFGFIGASGMLLCWVATYAFLPALLVVSEHLLASRRRPAAHRARLSRFEAPFAALTHLAPRRIAIGSVVLTVAGIGLTVAFVSGEPMENDMRKLENDKTTTAETYRASRLALEIVGARTESAMVVLTDRLDQVKPLQRALRARSAAAPAAKKPFEEVHSLFDFVPEQQALKLPLLAEIRKKLLRARELGGIEDEEWNEISAYVPPEDLQAFTAAELPKGITRWFTEADGTVGRVLYVEPTAGQSDNDLNYLRRFADAYRQTTLPGGETITGSGRAVVYADLVTAVAHNMPRALSLALLAVAIIVVLGFRRSGDALAVMASLVAGLALLGGAMALFDIRIHFINFAALPITLGIGADYALNIMHRYREGGGGRPGVQAALGGVTGPVVLCSLTTTLAYLALVTSTNQGVRSLGLIAVIGEVTCLLGAAVALPACLLWMAAARRSSSVRPGGADLAPGPSAG